MKTSSDEPIIKIRRLSKFFNEFQALNNINLDVAAGSRMVICGPSGSGKSTLIRCINRLEVHEKGSIIVDGIELDDSRNSQNAIKAKVGMVFQQFNLFPHLTVIENLMLGPVRTRGLSSSEAKEQAMRYLERVRIPEQAGKYPRHLSGGQQQRVAIARSLCMEPKIMLFDEPTSALDPEMINEVLDVIAELVETGITMICVTHEMGFARRVSDQMVFMDHGEVVEMATPEKFFNTPETDRCKNFLKKILYH